MIYMLLLGVIVLCVFGYVSYKQKAIVNGLLICTASLIIFNVILPMLYQYFNPETQFNYIYILLYYGVYYIGLALGYYILNKQKRVNIEFAKEVSPEKSKSLTNILLACILIICFFVLINTPVEYLKNPRLLYEKTRLGFGHIYFLLTGLLNIYFIFAMFTRKKYFYVIFVVFLMFFTGSKARILIPIEMLFLYYFYVKSNDRGNVIKTLVFGLGFVALFIGVFVMTAYYLPDKSFDTIVNNLANYSDYNRNFLMLVERLSETKEYFGGLITMENNFLSLIPRAIWADKPTIFGSFRLSYMIYPEWTLMFQGAPSFGTFGALFGDFGHLSLILIFIYNFIIGGLLGVAEMNFIKHKNAISFMVFTILMGILLIDVGLGATTILIINLVLVGVLYYVVKFLPNFNNIKIQRKK